MDITKTDWDAYEAQLADNMTNLADSFSNLDSSDKVDKAADLLSQSIMEAFNSATDLTYVSCKVKPPPWDTPAVKEARRDMRTKLRLAIKHKDSGYNKAKRESRQNYEKIRNHTWSTKFRDFCDKLEAKSDSKRISSLIKYNKNTQLGTVKKPDGSLTENPSETLDVMTEVHFATQVGGVYPPTDTQTTRADDTAEPRWGLDRIFSENRVRRALQEFGPLTAAGPDGIKPIMLQKGWDSIKQAFVSIAKASFLLGYTPDPWRKSLGIFLPKPGKDDYYNPKSYRTITLAPVPLKWMERVILWHMEVDLKIYSNLSKKQYGFKRGSSTIAAVHKLVKKFEFAILNVSFDAIERALDSKCKSAEVNRWISSMIHNRQTTVELQGERRTIAIRRGCPQGGILSPFLWNLVVNELLEYTRNKIPSDLQGFADDLALVSIVTAPRQTNGRQGYDADTLREVTQKSLNSINLWCRKSGLKLSHLKTHCVMFTKRRNWSFSRPLKVDGIEIEVQKSTKFLGVILDSKLSWNEHIENVCKKAKGILMQCRKAVGPTWGFKPATMRWVYEVMVRPVLGYGATIWLNGTRTQHNEKLLNGVQRLANVLITGAMPSTPGVALDVITGNIPITLWLEEESAKGALRLKNLNHWQHPPSGKLNMRLTSHITTNEKLLKSISEVRVPHDQKTPSLSIDQEFAVDIPNRDVFSEPIESEYDVNCYTDGSKMNEHVGAGIVVKSSPSKGGLNHNEAFHLDKHNTVLQAEVFAVGKTATFLLDNKIEGSKIMINCDSQAAIRAIDSTVIKNSTTLEATMALNTLGESNEITLIWIPAHCGYEGNELADQLAKRGSNNDRATRIKLPMPRCV